jgi:hypothetical protein
VGCCCNVGADARRSRARARGVCTPGHRLAARYGPRRQGVQSRARELGRALAGGAAVVAALGANKGLQGHGEFTRWGKRERMGASSPRRNTARRCARESDDSGGAGEAKSETEARRSGGGRETAQESWAVRFWRCRERENCARIAWGRCTVRAGSLTRGPRLGSGGGGRPPRAGHGRVRATRAWTCGLGWGARLGWRAWAGRGAGWAVRLARGGGGEVAGRAGPRASGPTRGREAGAVGRAGENERREGGGWAGRDGPGKGAGPLFLFFFSFSFLSLFYLFQFDFMCK